MNNPDKKLVLRAELIRNLDDAEAKVGLEDSSILKFYNAHQALHNHDAAVRAEQVQVARQVPVPTLAVLLRYLGV